MTGIKDFSLCQMVHQTDMFAPPDALEFYKTDEYKAKLEALLEKNRHIIDSQGLCQKLFDKYKSEDQQGGFTDSKYKTILVGTYHWKEGYPAARLRTDMEDRRSYVNIFCMLRENLLTMWSHDEMRCCNQRGEPEAPPHPCPQDPLH